MGATPAKMRVLITHQGAELYGSDRMVLTTAEALATRGAHVVFTTPRSGPLVDAFVASGIETVHCNVPVLRKADLRPSLFLGAALSSAAGVYRAVRLIQRVKPDVVYVNTIAQPVWLLAARLTARRAICHVREAETELRPILQRVLVRPLVLAHGLIYNSMSTRRFIEKNLPSTKHLGRVVYNGKDWTSLLLDAPEDPQGELAIAVVGRISPRKGQDVVVEAARILAADGVRSHIHFAGDVFPGYEDYMEGLREQIDRAGLVDRCTFHGFVSDVRGILEVSHIAVVPSRQEPFGSVAAESMVALRPTIASNVQGLGEIIQNGQTGWLFDMGDAAALAECVRRVVDDRSGSADVARAGREEVLDRFSVERYGDEIFQAVNEHSGGPE